ncbi:MAG: RDD family protein [Alphaproteobacteria bacterium]|nr:RDD family protein [Alphaproteobacteria bacterium]
MTHIPLPDLADLANASSVEGLRRKRLFAFIDDLLFVTMIYVVIMLILGILGLAPPGRPFLFAPILYPVIALFYNALTIGRNRQGTPGMLIMGLHMVQTNGARANALNGAAHALFFYLSIILLTPLILMIGIKSPSKRFVHDRLAGVLLTLPAIPES